MSPWRIFVNDCEGLQSKESCIVISLKERVRGDSRYMSQRWCAIWWLYLAFTSPRSSV